MKRTPLKRKTPLRSDPEKVKAFKDRNRKPLPKVNRNRKKKKYARNFGEKSEWMREEYPRCLVSGRTDFVQHAHTRGHAGMGGMNSDNKALAPLFWKVHIHFDHLTDERFEAAYPGWTKEKIREKADEIEAHWQEVSR